jgi:hypothetical protein
MTCICEHRHAVKRQLDSFVSFSYTCINGHIWLHPLLAVFGNEYIRAHTDLTRFKDDAAPRHAYTRTLEHIAEILDTLIRVGIEDIMAVIIQSSFNFLQGKAHEPKHRNIRSLLSAML